MLNATEQTATTREPPQQEFTRRLHDTGMQAFQLSLTYNIADSAQSACSKLKYAAPAIFRTLISGNWKRAADRSDFLLLAYLDVPGSRAGRITAQAEQYHHHCILLARPRVCERLRALTRVHGAEVELTKIPETRTKLAKIGLRNCYLQVLSSTQDIARATLYASKATDALSNRYIDPLFTIFP